MSIRSGRRIAGILIVAVVATVVAIPLAATAAIHTISLDKQVIRGNEGDRVGLGTFSTPGDLVGQSCTVSASGNNNTSVHPGNNVEVTSENTVTLAGVEDSPNKTTVAGGLLTLSDSISFTLVLGPDGVFSAELDVTLDCEPPPTTSTTSSTTTTTTAPTTTTTSAPTTTTTTTPTTSTTAPTTTTVAPTSTTAAPTTTTTLTTSTTTAVGGQSTTTTAVTDETLPFTGMESDQAAAAALVALGAGAVLVLLTRRSAENQPDRP